VVEGSVTASAFIGDGSQLTGVVSSSYALTSTDSKNVGGIVFPQGGKVDVGASGGGTIVIVGVTFPTAFSTTPAVLCNASAQPGSIFDDSFNITTRNVSTTGFTMIVNRVDGGSWGQDLDAFWMAFEY
jgi:expansin (peptidoglycan-binding protein)